MQFPNNLLYSKEHTWALIEDSIGTIGITEFAQSELGEIVYVDLPSVGKTFKKDDIFGSVEALKTVSDLYMPISGTIIELNPALKESPTLVNEQPFSSGWMIKVKITKPEEGLTLLNSEQYREQAEV